MVGGATVLPSVLFAVNGRPRLGAMVGAVFMAWAVWGVVRLKTRGRTVPIRFALIGGTIGVAIGLFGLFITALVMLGIAFSGDFANDGR